MRATSITCLLYTSSVYKRQLEEIAGWHRPQIRHLFESYGFLIQGWDRVQTDWVTLRPSGVIVEKAVVAEAK